MEIQRGQRTCPEFQRESMSGSKPEPGSPSSQVTVLYLTVSFTIFWCNFIFLGDPFGDALGTTSELLHPLIKNVTKRINPFGEDYQVALHSHMRELNRSSRVMRCFRCLPWSFGMAESLTTLFLYDSSTNYSSESSSSRTDTQLVSCVLLGHQVLLALSCSVLTTSSPLYLQFGFRVLSLKVLISIALPLPAPGLQSKHWVLILPGNLGFTTIPACEHFNGGLIVIHAVIVM